MVNVLEEIRKESKVICGRPFDSWFVSDHVKEVLRFMLSEIDRLNRIIAKELVENDGLGSEFVYVNALKAELAGYRERLGPVGYKMVQEVLILRDEVKHLQARIERDQK